MNPEITAILLNYRRPTLMKKLVENLRGQTAPVNLMFVDNGPEAHPDAATLPIDSYTRVPWNGLTYIRLLLAFYVKTPWVMFLDDDRHPTDAAFVADSLEIAKAHRGGITGAVGRSLEKAPPHYREDVYGASPIIKGFFMMFEQSLLSKVPISPPMMRDGKWVARLDDIHFSLMSGRGRPIHWAERNLELRLANHDDLTVGLTADPEHVEIRNAVAKDYVEFLTQAGDLP